MERGQDAFAHRLPQGGRVGEVEAAFDAVEAGLDGLDFAAVTRQVAMHGRQIACDRGEPCRHVAQCVLKARLAGVERAHVFEQRFAGFSAMAPP